MSVPSEFFLGQNKRREAKTTEKAPHASSSAPSSSFHLSSSPILAAAAMLKAIIEAADAERTNNMQLNVIDHRQDNKKEELFQIPG